MFNTLEPAIQLIKGLTPEQRVAMKEYLETLLAEDKLNGITILNICLSSPCEACPHCASDKITRHGKYKNRQRYKCNRCDRTFNDLTGTVLHYIHDHNKFQKYFKCLAEQKSLRECQREVGICLHTSFYWRHKILKSFDKMDLKPLKKHIEADDTFIAESFKGNPAGVVQRQRAPRKRGGGITKRGIHDEHACILAACDHLGNTVLTHTGMGRLTKEMVSSTLSPFIRKQRVNKAIFVTDKHNAYVEFAATKNLNHQTVVAAYNQRVNVLGFHIQTVNALHSRFKRWLSRFNGVATKYLPNYLNYFRLWDKFTYIKERLVHFVTISGKNSNAFQKISDIYLE